MLTFQLAFGGVRGGHKRKKHPGRRFHLVVIISHASNTFCVKSKGFRGVKGSECL